MLGPAIEVEGVSAMTGTEFWALGYFSGMLVAWLMRKTERPPRTNR